MIKRDVLILFNKIIKTSTTETCQPINRMNILPLDEKQLASLIRWSKTGPGFPYMEHLVQIIVVIDDGIPSIVEVSWGACGATSVSPVLSLFRLSRWFCFGKQVPVIVRSGWSSGVDAVPSRFSVLEAFSPFAGHFHFRQVGVWYSPTAAGAWAEVLPSIILGKSTTIDWPTTDLCL
jgi:hypothetical protein